MTSHDYMIEEPCDFVIWGSFKDLMNIFLICYVTSCDHVINIFSDFVDNSTSSETSILLNLLVMFVNLATWAKS